MYREMYSTNREGPKQKAHRHTSIYIHTVYLRIHIYNAKTGRFKEEEHLHVNKCILPLVISHSHTSVDTQTKLNQRAGFMLTHTNRLIAPHCL